MRRGLTSAYDNHIMSAVDRDKATRAACECAGKGDGEMSINRDIKTAKEAIDASVERNEIINVCLSMTEADALGISADGCVEIYDEPRRTEYWGKRFGDGAEWRVHDYVA